MLEGKAKALRRAQALLVCSAVLFGAMAFLAKLATAELSGAQVAMLRFSIHLLPILLIPQIARASFQLGRIDLLFYRGLFGGLAVLLYFLAIEHIPVGLATLLNYTAPVYSGLFAAMFIGERVRPRVLLPLMAAFAGIFLVIRANSGPGSLGFSRWALAGICSAIFSGAAVTALRVARRSESSWPIFASLSVFGLIATAPFGLWQWKNPSLHQWLLVLLVGLFSIGAQLTMTHAYRWVETLTAGVISQLGVVVSMTLGVVWLGERLNTTTLLGAGLTLGGIIALMWVTSRPHPTAFDEAPEQ